MPVNRLTLIKTIEFALAIICFWLHTQSRTGYSTTETVSLVAFGGYIIILGGIFIGKLTDTGVHSKIDMYFTIVGCVLFAYAGYLNIDYFGDDGIKAKNYGLIKGALAVINAVIFLVDAILNWRA